MKFYAAGGLYHMGDRMVFSFAKPQNGKPYVWPENHPDGYDGTLLHMLTRHHASTYLIAPDGKSLTRKYGGDDRDNTDPKTVTLDPQQQADIAEGVARATRDLEAIGVPVPPLIARPPVRPSARPPVGRYPAPSARRTSSKPTRYAVDRFVQWSHARRLLSSE